jgi:hypothetical protein
MTTEELIPKVRTDRDALKLMHDTQVSIEKIRIAASNRVYALTSGRDDADSDIIRAYVGLTDELARRELEFEELMVREAEKFPVYDAWLRHVKGIGPALASQMLAMLLPPLPERGPSTWYKASGLTVEEHDGQSRLPRARAGQEGLPYYPRLRRCLHNVATSFVRVGGYYREVYDTRKARLQAQHAGDEKWPPHRIDAVARWIMVKLFLAHLWEVWLETEGVTGRRAYVIDVLGHPHYEPPPMPEKGKKI